MSELNNNPEQTDTEFSVSPEKLMPEPYSYAQFDPRPVGKEHNEDIFLKGDVYGIEVTVPGLAERCVINIDHHGPEDTADTPSAAEQAMSIEIDELPPRGATLATVRPDADSVTAMAVLSLRDNGSTDWSREIVEAVGTFDRYGPSAGRPDDRAIAIARTAFNFSLSLEERVNFTRRILTGSVEEAEISDLVSRRDGELAEAAKASDVQLIADGRIAVVTSKHRYATTLGYELAPVVVASNPEMPVDFRDPEKGTYEKYTVCKYDDHVPADLNGALRELQEMEDGWGGRGTIFGSPQGVSSKLTLEQITEVVERYLK